MALTSCEGDSAGMKESPQTIIEYKSLSHFYFRHRNAPLKILAIGNSFTNNATYFMPWFVNQLNEDSVCVAKLTRTGCTLSMHWGYHLENKPEYEFYYSDEGDWKLTAINTIDMALTVFDWDIIIIQQASGMAGDYSTFQPALEYLVGHFRATNPNVKVAWHYTWPYKEGTVHADFYRYDNDPQKMYDAILKTGDLASQGLEIKLPSATLIWEMRRQYPEVTDQFSTDGFHISSGLGSFALSTLWYELLVKPELGTSCRRMQVYPSGLDSLRMAKADAIIDSLLE